MQESISVVSLKIKNFMSISDLEIKPAQVNVITGRNEQGKTTILKAIKAAAKNEGDINLVKRGADQAEIIIELKDEYVIDRKIKADGTNKLQISRGHGDEKEKLSSPQTVVDRIFDNVAFNPIDLLDPKKRSESIMASIPLTVDALRLSQELDVSVDELPPLDYNKHGLHVLDQAYKFYYQRRAEANKDSESKKQKYTVNNAEMKSFSEPDKTESQLAEWHNTLSQEKSAINAEREKLKAQNSLIEKENARVVVKNETIKSYDDKIISIENKIKELETERENVLNAKSGYLAATGDLETKGLVDFSVVDEKDEINKSMFAKYNVEVEKIATYKSNLNAVKMIDAMKVEWESSKAFADELTKKVELLKSELKKKMLAEIDMPIEGLEFVDGEFYLNGNTLDLLSSSAALKLAIAIARKLAKRTKLICIDGAEMIDDENFAALSKEIKDDGFTYFITRVGDPVALEGQKVFKMENGTASEV